MMDWVPLYQAIDSSTTSLSTFVMVVDVLNRTWRRPLVNNNTESLIVKLRTGTFHMDWNGFFEIGGHYLKRNAAEFYRHFITHDNSPNSAKVKFYYLRIQVPKQKRLTVFLNVCEVATFPDQDVYRTWASVNSEQVMEAMVIGGLFPGQGHPNITAAPNYQTDWRVNVPECLNLLIRLQEFLILADPSALPLAPNEEEPDLYTPVTDPNGNLVHVRGNNHNLFTVAYHLSQDEKEIVLPQLASHLLRAVDYHGQEEDGRIYGPSFPNLMTGLGMDLQSAAFNTILDGFLANLQDVVSTLVGGLDNAELHYQFTACVCPFPEPPFDSSWEIDAPSFNLQVPIRNLSDRNILTYRGVVPLRAEGSFSGSTQE
ncbi:MAG: hypothetical protein ACRCZI_01535 [Cetobacterium sp.]